MNQDLKALSPKEIGVDYLFWVCENSEKRILDTCMKSGTTVESINAAALMNYEIPVAPIEEQAVIVRVLVKLLAKEHQALTAAAQVLDQIDTMKKAILARAFRGELGTNVAEEENAGEVVRRIVQ